MPWKGLILEKTESEFDLEVYAYIRALHKQLDLDFNVLDSSELSRQTKTKKLSDLQILAICEIRYWYHVVVLNNLRVLENPSDSVAEKAIENNITFISNAFSESKYSAHISPVFNKYGMTSAYFHKEKIHLFAKTLLNINKDRLSPQILYVGARTEGEIFVLTQYGFDLDLIEAIDLFSYSPFIKLMDMHALTYSPNTFNICVLSHCLPYSENYKLAIEEALRVLKPEGYLVITYSNDSQLEVKAIKDYVDGIPRLGAVNEVDFEEVERFIQASSLPINSCKKVNHPPRTGHCSGVDILVCQKINQIYS